MDGYMRTPCGRVVKGPRSPILWGFLGLLRLVCQCWPCDMSVPFDAVLVPSCRATRR